MILSLVTLAISVACLVLSHRNYRRAQERLRKALETEERIWKGGKA